MKMEKEKLRHEKKGGPKKGQRRSGEVMEAVAQGDLGSDNN